MIVAEKYKHRPHQLEVVEVTLDNYLEVSTYIGSSETILSHLAETGEWTVTYQFSLARRDQRMQNSVIVNLPGKISINHEKDVLVVAGRQEEFLKKNYKKA